jgi:hypothetical protein
LLFGVTEGADEACDRQQQQQARGDIGDRGGLTRLRAELAEAVRGEQQAAQGLTLEEGLELAGLAQLGEVSDELMITRPPNRW